MTIYLYVKTHNITGLKYLGKTKKDPFTYLGSGSNWKKHLATYGKDHSTEIICECQTNQELNKWGRYYSDLWDIVKNPNWANRIPETGGGGVSNPEINKKISNALKGKKKPPRTEEHKKKLRAALKGTSNQKTSIGLKKWYSTNPDRSMAIQKQSESLKQWYIDNHESARLKGLKTVETRYRSNYERYKYVIELLNEGKLGSEIRRVVNIDKSTIKKLKDRSHRFFIFFPELK